MTDPFRRVDGRGGRRYELAPPLVPEKIALDSVTTILSGGVPKPALKAWGERLVAEAAVDNVEFILGMEHDDAVDWLKQAPRRNMQKAGRRGSAIHLVAEQLLAGEGVDPTDLPHATFVQAFIDEWIGETLGIEQPIVNLEDGWAGTADLIFRDKQGSVWLADWKTGKGVYPDYALQLAAYAHGTHWVVPFSEGSAEQLALEDPPVIHRIALLHLTDKGLSVHEPNVSIDKLYGDFRAAHRIHRALKDNKLVKLTAAPRPTLDEYITYLRARCEWSDERSPIFRSALKKIWPAGVPTLKAGGLSFFQCKQLNDVLDEIDKELDIPFGPTGPTQPWR
jgi:hypothetical protein